MNLHQLKFIDATVKCQFNLTEVAKRLYISQPAVSKAISQIEEELGVTIFTRNAKRLKGLTPIGEEIYKHIQLCLFNIEQLKTLAQQYRVPDEGMLKIATTHTQARYSLPAIIQKFMLRFPKVKLSIIQGEPSYLLNLLKQDAVDIVIASEMQQDAQYQIQAAFDWQHILIAPKNHAIFSKNTETNQAINPQMTLAEIISHPIITYDLAFAGRKKINQVLIQSQIYDQTNIILEAMDSDIIKTYVKLGLGVGIMTEMAWDEEKDPTLLFAPLGHLFGIQQVKIALKSNKHQREYIYDFIKLLQKNPFQTM
jgi:LysR family transcriptional regulator, cys regulon transcriptional activator